MSNSLKSLFLLCAALSLCTACDDGSVPSACSGDGLCPGPSPRVVWAAQLLPGNASLMNRPGNSQLVAQEAPALVFGQGGDELMMRFTQPALLRGQVADGDGRPLPRARVVATLPSAIPGQVAATFETSTDDQGTFSLRVPVPQKPAQQPFRLWIGFDDAAQAAVHPPYWQSQVVSGDSSLSLRLPRTDGLFPVSGHVLSPFGAGVAGMRVQVLDEEQQIVSTTQMTQGDGSYRLLIDPSMAKGQHLLVVATPNPMMSGTPLLTYQLQRPEVWTAFQVEFRLPSYRNPLPFQLRVHGVGTSGETMMVGGAQVQAQTILEDPALSGSGQKALYTASAETDKEGLVTLPLVPAPTGGTRLQLYTVTVISPAQSPFASTTLSLWVGPQAGYLSAQPLPLRAQVSGRLLGAKGQPVANAQLQAHSLGGDTTGGSAPGAAMQPLAVPEATTDPDGRFALRLDPGRYDLYFLPQIGTQPNYSVDSQRVQMDDVDLGAVRLPGPALAKVLVVGPDGYPVAGAKVKFFQMPVTPSGCGGMPSCPSIAKLRAEFYTGSKGRAEFLLPAGP